MLGSRYQVFETFWTGHGGRSKSRVVVNVGGVFQTGCRWYRDAIKEHGGRWFRV